MDYILYGAYGSNLNKAQMAFRCPRSMVAGVAMLRGWRLCYKGSKTGAYLDIEETGNKGDIVPLGLWKVPKPDELSLDRYEGYPNFYVKKHIPIEGSRSAMVYVMRDGAEYGVPSAYYVNTCEQGYRDFNLDEHMHILDDALQFSWEKVHGL